MTLEKTIQQAMEQWDGKSTDDIGNIYQLHSSNSNFMPDLIKSMQQAGLQKAASWLIKHSLEAGALLTSTQTRSLFQQLDKLQQWESCLHILQSIPFLKIPQADIKKLDHFLRQSLTNENKFVRAWSYNGLYELARQHPGDKIDGQSVRQQECLKFFEMAMKDEAPSVKARIRNIIKKGF